MEIESDHSMKMWGMFQSCSLVYNLFIKDSLYTRLIQCLYTRLTQCMIILVIKIYGHHQSNTILK